MEEMIAHFLLRSFFPRTTVVQSPPINCHRCWRRFSSSSPPLPCPLRAAVRFKCKRVRRGGWFIFSHFESDSSRILEASPCRLFILNTCRTKKEYSQPRTAAPPYNGSGFSSAQKKGQLELTPYRTHRMTECQKKHCVVCLQTDIFMLFFSTG